MDALSIAYTVFTTEIAALEKLKSAIDINFSNAVQAIRDCRGKLILSGIGKSGLIAAKMAATFSSTGTPAIYVHASEASHGDLGVIGSNDLMLLISKSGNTSEFINIINYCKSNNIKIIAITTNVYSILGTGSDIVLCLPKMVEACHIGNAPTTSSTATLVLGDALAVACSQLNNFTKNDFQKYHPGGYLGKNHITVANIMKPILSSINITTSFNDVLLEINKNNLGIVCVCEDNKVIGVITDGDIRRAILLAKTKVIDIMSQNPIIADPNDSASLILDKMNEHGISCVPVVSSSLLGYLHVHDCLRAGL